MPGEQTYSLWKGKGGSEFQRLPFSDLPVAVEIFADVVRDFMKAHPRIYDFSWKDDEGEVWVIRRDGAERGGEE